MSNELQLVIGICALAATIVWIYTAIRNKGIPGANTELQKLLADPGRLDRIEYTLNSIRSQSPQHEILVSTIRSTILDITRTMQQVQLEAFKLGLVVPFNEDAAKLLANINKTVDVVTDQKPNVTPETPSNEVAGLG